MEKAKRKHGELNINFYWRIFLPLALILLFCLPFPIRITIPDLYDDILLYGSISFASFLTALWIYRRSKWLYRKLLFLVVLCGILAGLQVIDSGVLHNPDTSGIYGFGVVDFYENESMMAYTGFAWLNPRFKSDGRCDSIFERYIGNYYIAIRIEMHRTDYYTCWG